jgi:hypothetical protein
MPIGFGVVFDKEDGGHETIKPSTSEEEGAYTEVLNSSSFS